MIVAIDGTAASGKGTLARHLAEHLGLKYLDTGSLYRAVGLRVLDSGGNPEDERAAAAAARSITAEDVADARLREEIIGQAASIVSAMPEVRAALLQFQRDFAGQGAVLDGRDIGTVVCPQARHKFFLTASLEARARRRCAELGTPEAFPEVLADLKERDARDSRRAIAPMVPAADAVVIDTSEMDAEEVFRRIRDAISLSR